MSTDFDTIKNDEEQFLCRSYSRYPLAIVKGKGSRLWDVDGKEYIDLLAGIAVTALGHAHDEVTAAISQQAATLTHVSNLFYQKAQIRLAKLLCSTAHFTKVFFCNSGAEANEACIKLARRYMRKVLHRDAYEIITLEGCFHGRTYGSLAATGRANLQDGFEPFPAGFKQVPVHDIAALRAAISDKTAAVMMEAVQGEGGIKPLDLGYLQQVQALCKEKNVLLIMDEVQAGLCRTGKFWAFQHAGITPDIISTAKSLANGLPMGAMLTTDAIAQGFVAGSHATTFGGGELVATAAATVVEIMLRDTLAQRAHCLGEHVKTGVQAIAARVPNQIKEVRGMGLMLGIELTASGKAVWLELLRRGIICNLSHDVTLRLLPPLTIDKADLDVFLTTLESVLRDNAAGLLPAAK